MWGEPTEQTQQNWPSVALLATSRREFQRRHGSYRARLLDPDAPETRSSPYWGGVASAPFFALDL